MTARCLLIAMLLCGASAAPPRNALEALNGVDGLAYLRLAEDVIDAGNDGASLQLARELLVLSIVAESRLRRSALLALLEIETDARRRRELLGLLESTPSPLVSVDVSGTGARPPHGQRDVLAVCSALSAWRRGDPAPMTKLGPAAMALLRYHGHLLPGGPGEFLERIKDRRVRPSEHEIVATLHAELVLLGGDRSWSADAAALGRQPLSLGGGGDVAMLMGVDPSRTRWLNGRWVLPR